MGLHHEVLSAANYLAVLIGLATINIQIEKMFPIAPRQVQAQGWEQTQPANCQSEDMLQESTNLRPGSSEYFATNSAKMCLKSFLVSGQSGSDTEKQNLGATQQLSISNI